MKVFVLLCSAVLFTSSLGRDLSDEEYYNLPQLYHLDNYEKCLSHDEGVYCLGTFHVTAREEPHPIYELMKEYSKETYAFNHTLIHRGYCISSRCPDMNNTDLTTRFERCTAEIVAKQNLLASLMTLKYCQTKSTQRFEKISIAQIAFLVVIAVLLIVNLIGTVYDFRTRDNPKRIRILIAWSILKNWKALTSNGNKGDSGLTALHGIRVCVAIMMCLSHCALMFYTLYIYNPRTLEKLASHPLSMFVQNSTGTEQMFVVMSGFLYTVHLRVYAEKHRISYRQLPMFIAKRVIRISPVILLMVSFAATWWPVLGNGPLWAATIGAESQVCKEKFWTHALFVNNLVQADRHCILPIWYMAVDLQMHILSTLVMLLLLQYPRRMLLNLCLLFAASCVLYAALVYVFDWIPMLYLSVSPENLRTLFHNVPSFSGLYIAPWGCISPCFLGLILGHLYYDLKDKEFIFGRYKWILYVSCIVSVPLLCAWLLLGFFLQHIKAKAFMVAYAAMERSIFQILCLLSYVVLSVLSGFMIKILAWRGWHTLSRMSLSIMTMHWLVNYYLVATSPQPLSTSVTDIGIYGISTAVYTFLFAVPITILVEMPMKNFFDVVSS